MLHMLKGKERGNGKKNYSQITGSVNVTPFGARGEKLRKPGIEPGAQRWQRWILPLNHLREVLCGSNMSPCY